MASKLEKKHSVDCFKHFCIFCSEVSKTTDDLRKHVKNHLFASHKVFFNLWADKFVEMVESENKQLAFLLNPDLLKSENGILSSIGEEGCSSDGTEFDFEIIDLNKSKTFFMGCPACMMAIKVFDLRTHLYPTIKLEPLENGTEAAKKHVEEHLRYQGVKLPEVERVIDFCANWRQNLTTQRRLIQERELANTFRELQLSKKTSSKDLTF